MKNIYKNGLLGSIVAFFGSFSLIRFAYAQGFFKKLQTAGTTATLKAGGSDQLINTIGNIINVFLSFLGVIALVIVIYAGFLWMTAGGNEDHVDKAKTYMKNAVIGLIIISLAYALTAFFVTLANTTPNTGV